MREAGKDSWKACLVRIDRSSKDVSIDFEDDHPEKWLIIPSTVRQMAETLRPVQEGAGRPFAFPEFDMMRVATLVTHSLGPRTPGLDWQPKRWRWRAFRQKLACLLTANRNACAMVPATLVEPSPLKRRCRRDSQQSIGKTSATRIFLLSARTFSRIGPTICDLLVVRDRVRAAASALYRDDA